jgi:hypothetical protein
LHLAGCFDPKLKAKYDARLAEWEQLLREAQKGLTGTTQSAILSKPPVAVPQTPAPASGAPISTETGKHNVQFVGKIDREKFKEVSPDITTDEVIITDERIQHIKDGHPGDFEKLLPHLSEILENPDYILASTRNYTGEVLKDMGVEKGKIILRVHVPTDPEDFKNSILTGMVIDDRTWKRLVKNKKVLYKRE